MEAQETKDESKPETAQEQPKKTRRKRKDSSEAAESAEAKPKRVRKPKKDDDDIPEIHRFEGKTAQIEGKTWINGVGKPDAEIMLVDTWPSDDVRRRQRAFSDRTGAVLLNLLHEIGIDPKECYSTYAVKYAVPRGKKPSAKDRKICRLMLREEIEMVKPRIIIAFGADAWSSLVDTSAYPHGCCRGEPIKVSEDGSGPWYMPSLNLAQVMANGGEYFLDGTEIGQVPQQALVHTALRELETVMEIIEDEKKFFDEREESKPKYKVMRTAAEVRWFKDFLFSKGEQVLLGLDCEWDGENWLDPGRYLRTIQIGFDYGLAGIVEISTEGGERCCDDFDAVMKEVKGILEHPLAGIVGHNVIADGEWLLQYGVDIREKVVYDTMLGEYLLCEDGPFGLEECAMKYAPYGRYCATLELWVHSHAKMCSKGYGPVPRDILLPYGAADVDCLRYIMDRQIPRIRELGYFEPRGTEKEYPSIFAETMNTQRVLYEVEGTGLPVDIDLLHDMTEKFQSMKSQLLSQVVTGAAVAGMPNFNPGSPDQVRKLLFDVLNLPPVKTTEGKDWAMAVGNRGLDEDIDESAATDKQTLEILGDRHPLCHALLQFRRIDQYCKTWLRAPDPKHPGRGIEAQMWADGRLHSRMSQLSTTSRFKSSAPNSQNFPKKAEGFLTEIFGEGNVPPVLRTIVVPPKGMVMMEADFQQAELFTIASLSGDPHMIDVLKTPGRDMHTSIAAKAFGYHMFDENHKEWTEDDIVELVAKQYGGDAENEEFKKWQKHLVFRDAHGNEMTYSQFKSGPRISGKNVNFGILYGRGGADTAIQVKAETGAAESLDVLAAQLDLVIKTWKTTEYPVAWQYIESCMAKVYDPGYITNPWGRRRRAPFLRKGEKRPDAERNFANFP